jgi:hypothetical protein
LLSLKKVLQLSRTCQQLEIYLDPPPCPAEYGLFGTIFTTIVVNLSLCQ